MFRVRRHDGNLAVIWEFLFQAFKPFLRLYEWLLWHSYLKRQRRPFEVLGSRITVLNVDQGVSRELAVHRIHEPLATRLLQQHLKPGMTVVDVGSNIGYYALLESRLIEPGGKVIAIEPVPQNFAQLRENIRANGRENIEIHQLAIAERSGTLPMYLSGRSNWHSLRPTPAARTCNVIVSTLDDFLSRVAADSVDLVRMDVEGYEIEIIKGMQRTLDLYCPLLLVELHPDLVGAKAIVEYLRILDAMGYMPEFVFEQERDYSIRWKFVRPEHPTMRQLMRHPLIVRDQRALTALFSCVRRAELPAASSTCFAASAQESLST